MAYADNPFEGTSSAFNTIPISYQSPDLSSLPVSGGNSSIPIGVGASMPGIGTPASTAQPGVSTGGGDLSGDVTAPSFWQLLPGALGGPAGVDFRYQQLINAQARPVMGRLTREFAKSVQAGDFDRANEAVTGMYNLSSKVPQFGPMAQQFGQKLADTESKYRANTAILDVADKTLEGNPKWAEVGPALRQRVAMVPTEMMRKAIEDTFPEVKTTDYENIRIDKGTGQVDIEVRAPFKRMNDYTPTQKDAWANAQANNPGMMDLNTYNNIRNRENNDQPTRKSEREAAGLAERAAGEAFIIAETAQRIPTIQGLEGQFQGPATARSQEVAGTRRPPVGTAQPQVVPLAGGPAVRPPAGMPQQGPQQPLGAPGAPAPTPVPSGAPAQPTGQPRPPGVVPGRPGLSNVPKGNVDAAILARGTPEQIVEHYKQQGLTLDAPPAKPDTSGMSPSDAFKAEKAYGHMIQTWYTKTAQNIADYRTNPASEATAFLTYDDTTGKFSVKSGLSAAESNSGKWVSLPKAGIDYKTFNAYAKLEPQIEAFKEMAMKASKAAVGGTDYDSFMKAVRHALALGAGIPGTDIHVSIPTLLSPEQKSLLVQATGVGQALENFVNPEHQKNVDMALVKRFITGITADRQSMYQTADDVLQLANRQMRGIVDAAKGRIGQAPRHDIQNPRAAEQQTGGSPGEKLESDLERLGEKAVQGYEAAKPMVRDAWNQFRQATEGTLADKARAFLNWAKTQGAEALKAAGEVIEQSKAGTQPRPRRPQRTGSVNTGAIDTIAAQGYTSQPGRR